MCIKSSHISKKHLRKQGVMMKHKNVQIPEEIFVKLVKYFLLGMNDDEIVASICKYLTEKLDKLEKRSIYTTYKTSQVTEEREKARIEYLDKAGIPENSEHKPGIKSFFA